MQLSDLKDLIPDIGMNYGDVVKLRSGSDPMTISKINGVPGSYYESNRIEYIPIECTWYYEGRIHVESVPLGTLVVQPAVQRPDVLIDIGDLVVLNSGSCAMTVSSVSRTIQPMPDYLIKKYALPMNSCLPPYYIAECHWFHEGKIHSKALDVYDLTLIYDADTGQSYDDPTLKM